MALCLGIVGGLLVGWAGVMYLHGVVLEITQSSLELGDAVTVVRAGCAVTGERDVFNSGLSTDPTLRMVSSDAVARIVELAVEVLRERGLSDAEIEAELSRNDIQVKLGPRHYE